MPIGWQFKSDWLTAPRNPDYQDLQNLMLDQGRAGVSQWGGDVDAGGHSLLNLSSFGSGSGPVVLGSFSGTTSNLLRVASPGGFDSSLRLMEAADSYGFSLNNVHADGLHIKRHSASSAGATVLYVGRDSGSIGIGTVTPTAEAATARLAVVGVSGQKASSLAESNTKALVSFRPNLNSGYTLAVGCESVNSFPYLQGVNWNGGVAACALLLNPYGNGAVGVGVTNPGAAFEVASPTSGDQIRIHNGSPYLYKIGREQSFGLLQFEGTQVGNRGFKFNLGPLIQAAPNSAITDSWLDNGQMSIWYDEAGSRLVFRVKSSTGALKTGYISVT